MKKVFLCKLTFFIFSRSLPGGLISLLSNAVVVCRPFSSFPLVVRCPISHAVVSGLSSTAFVVRRCCCPPSPSSSSVTVNVHCRHDPPLQPSLPICVAAISCHLLLSILVVCRPILHAVVVCRCRCPPLLSSTAAAVFRCRSHLHHSAVSAISHRPLSSFPIAVRRPITPVIVVRHHPHPPPSSSAVAVPPLVLPPTRCRLLRYELCGTTTTGYLWWY